MKYLLGTILLEICYYHSFFRAGVCVITLNKNFAKYSTREILHSHRGNSYPRGSLSWFLLGRTISNEPSYPNWDPDTRVKSAFISLSAARRERVYTIVIKIIVDISPATVPAPPFCPNYFLTRPIKGAGVRSDGGCFPRLFEAA